MGLLLTKFGLTVDPLSLNILKKAYPMIGNIHSPRAKHVIVATLVIMVWQFSYPANAGAVITDHEIQQKENIKSLTLEQDDINYRLPENPDRPQPVAKQTMYISVTAYSSTPDQTSGDPFVTASGTPVRDGVIAANFLPIGSRVRFPDKFGNKIFVVEDRMSNRYWHKADIWMPSRSEALAWGVQYIKIEIL